MGKLVGPDGLQTEICDVCKGRVSQNLMVLIPNEFAQPEINQVCRSCFDKATREFYIPLRDIFKRMHTENAWRD